MFDDAHSRNGLIAAPSAHGVKDTIDRLERGVKARGMTVFARIDHAAGATDAGLMLPPMQLLIFGAARAGTPLMQSRPTMGIDLPLKMLAWEDAVGKTWLAYNRPEWLAARHGVESEGDATVKAMAGALAALAQEAAEA